jgi:hypothetical protein
MVLKGVFAALLGATLLAGSSAFADEYRPDEFLKLDLSQAALSPKLLGPATQFKPVAVEAKVDPAAKVAPVRTAEATRVRTVKVKRVRTVKVTRTAKHHPAVRTRLAHRHSNPLDAQAFDPRIQVWPCKSGGICNLRPQRQ